MAVHPGRPVVASLVLDVVFSPSCFDKPRVVIDYLFGCSRSWFLNLDPLMTSDCKDETAKKTWNRVAARAAKAGRRICESEPTKVLLLPCMYSHLDR